MPNQIAYSPNRADQEIWNQIKEHLRRLKTAIASLSTDDFRQMVTDCVARDLRDNTGVDIRQKNADVAAANYPAERPKEIVTGTWTHYEYGSHTIKCT